MAGAARRPPIWSRCRNGKSLDHGTIGVPRAADHRRAVRGEDMLEGESEYALDALGLGLGHAEPPGAQVIRLHEAHEPHHHLAREIEITIGLRPVLQAVP